MYKLGRNNFQCIQRRRDLLFFPFHTSGPVVASSQVRYFVTVFLSGGNLPDPGGVFLKLARILIVGSDRPHINSIQTAAISEATTVLFSFHSDVFRLILGSTNNDQPLAQPASSMFNKCFNTSTQNK